MKRKRKDKPTYSDLVAEGDPVAIHILSIRNKTIKNIKNGTHIPFKKWKQK